ncbi:hypothetical protein [Roseovarius sp. A-2]|uniref:hypothetical protein n=1 Tax=Roseovarius sp. A-2 TaxID=1570360 RepID=UPI0020CB4DB4|nr:hypothetical protein [Roseovarius sp. A-2]
MVIALGAAMAAVGFAHRDLTGDTGRSVNPEYLAYLAAGGSADDLCAQGAHGGGIDHDSATTRCEACRLVASVLLPGQAALPEPWSAPRAARVTRAPEWHLALACAHARPNPRAPPRA